jgi:hypothetical protein
MVVRQPPAMEQWGEILKKYAGPIANRPQVDNLPHLTLMV